MSLVYIIGRDGLVTDLFKHHGHEVINLENPVVIGEDIPDNPGLVVFTGGSDVWPQLYNEKNTHSSVSIKRDIEELVWFHKFLHLPKVGICRGGQFLNVCNGGRMIQDIPNHAIAGKHLLIDDVIPPYRFMVTSTHHQAMVGYNAFISATSSKEIGKVQEVLWYGSTKSLCFQPHPEYGSFNPEEDTTLHYFAKCLSYYHDFKMTSSAKTSIKAPF